VSKSTYGMVQDRLLDEDRLATITVETVTPLRIGGYNAKPYSERLQLMEKPRTQSLKGVWRWWARALIAGALLSFNGKEIELTNINEKLNPLLGSTTSASKLSLRIHEIEKGAVIKGENLQKKISRINLLMRSRDKKEQELIKREELYYKELKFKVDLIRRVNIKERKEKFALASLTLAFMLGGLGSIQTRGLGKFTVSLDDKTRSKNLELGGAIDRVYGSSNSAELTDALIEMIKLAFDYTQSFLKSKSKLTVKVKRSLIPAIIPNSPNIFRIKTFKKPYNNPIEALIHIGNATLGRNWRRFCFALTRNINICSCVAYMLGLPRGRRFRGRRRANIGFSVIRNKAGYMVVMYGFKTTDITRLLKGPREFRERILDGSFDIAWESIKRSLEAQNERR